MRAGGRSGLLVCLAVLTLAPSPTRASCAAATVDGTPHDRRAGQLILVAGKDWASGCDDVRTSCGGCGSCEQPGAVEPAPIEEVVVSLERRGDHVAELGTIDLDEGASFAEELRLPKDLEPGRYRLVARGAPAAEEAWSPLRITR